MDGFDPLTSFGPDVAARDVEHVRGDEDETVAFLAGLAAGRPVCEFAVGTGRIAIPLAATGLDVCGIDQSAAMLEQLAARPGGAGIRAVRGDMTSDAPDGRFGLVYLVYNTIGNVLTQEGQVSVFRNAASRLTDDGVFVVENFTLWQTMAKRQFVDAEHVANDAVVLDVNTFDPATQPAGGEPRPDHGRRHPARADRAAADDAGRAGPDGRPRRADLGRAMGRLAR